ncbi:MAG TPA: branched-chain amino acid ABC transporter permease/ATP-binding protein [Baekduia sp.]|uniref:branched-chain amino acid ABC transporter permease/ATP-binding protein n=1 Tax=Baekduia sp. TaxID=2600305 RepID=UPI002D77AC91|nr:branched-chain amino acid ABC transporter permease/ATP-binding protein [Baekduia sp.]HET6509071.1 branched-chain amino acid ABC transporter permease/ATP-binding protein [Baekduia sp.]
MLWPFIITGLVSGAVYGLAGVGLVLTYKTSAVFNFAHGALATVSAFLFYAMSVQHGLAWPVAAAIAILVVGPLLALGLEYLTRSIVGENLAVQVTATVGVLLIVQAIFVLIYGVTQTRSVPVFLASGQTRIGSTFIQHSDIITFAFSLVATAGLYLFFRFGRMGTAMRAVVDDPSLVEISGMSTTRVRRVAWLIGVVFASACGVLFAPLVQLDSTVITLLVVQAFGAAALGAFRSLPLTFAGGLLIGVLASLCTKWFTSGVLAGLPPAVPFIVLFVALLVFPKRYLVEQSRSIPLPRPAWTAPMPMQIGLGGAVVVVLLLVPTFAGVHLDDWTTALGTIILFLSLGLLVRTSGQVSLCHVGFAAIGVAAFAHFTTDLSIPWLPALLLAGLVAVPIGALLAIPAMRLTGLYLAIATFGFGIALSYMAYTQSFMFGDVGGGLTPPRPHLSWLPIDTDTGFYYLLLFFVILSALFVVALTRSRLGRLLQGLADSPRALMTTGVSINVTRLMVFCISAFLAAIGGALIGVGQGAVSANSYPPLLSLTYLVLVVIVGGRAPWYAVVAGLALVVVPSYVSGFNTSYWLQLVFGASAVIYALTPPEARGMPIPLRRLIDRLMRRHDVRQRSGRPADLGPAPAARASGQLEVRGVTVRFGGVVAVDDVSLTVPQGRVTGLIGPNGAGKTTLFNAASGLRRPEEAQIVLNAHDVTRRGPAARARLGLGRTFQHAELFDSLTVFENVALGYEGSRAGGNPLTQLVTRRAERADTVRAAWSALELCGIAELADLRAGDLSTGRRRLVDLARCLAGPYNILLLDEPSSGLDVAESRAFGDVLERVVAERGVGILLVEHDMSLVMRLCEHIHVVDFGKEIFTGSPGEVRAAPVVRDAYLGDAGVEEHLPAAHGVGAGEAS